MSCVSALVNYWIRTARFKLDVVISRSTGWVGRLGLLQNVTKALNHRMVKS